MRALTIAKACVLSLLLAGAFVSSELQFDITPLREFRKAKRLNTDLSTDHAVQSNLSDIDIAETQARPLFSASRRPFVAPVIAVDQPAQNMVVDAATETSPRRLRLLGVTIFAGSFTALVQNNDSSETRWIGKGQEFDGWVLIAADKQSAHFACAQNNGSDCKYDVELYADQHAE